MGCRKVDAVATTPCFGFAEIGKASWLPSPITGWISSSAFLPNKSPLLRHVFPPLVYQVLLEPLGANHASPELQSQHLETRIDRLLLVFMRFLHNRRPQATVKGIVRKKHSQNEH